MSSPGGGTAGADVLAADRSMSTSAKSASRAEHIGEEIVEVGRVSPRRVAKPAAAGGLIVEMGLWPLLTGGVDSPRVIARAFVFIAEQGIRL